MEKYPRTFHLPGSPGATSDDKYMTSTLSLERAPALVVTEKMDGGNFTMTREACYGRSPSAVSQPWDAPARALWASVRSEIPPGWRVVGESMYARRSVAYDDLPGPFLMFGVFSSQGILLSWEETETWAELLDLPTVPVLSRQRGLQLAGTAWTRSRSSDSSEGYVVRSAGEILRVEFSLMVGKWVRADHVRTSDDWRRRDDFAVNTFRR